MRLAVINTPVGRRLAVASADGRVAPIDGVPADPVAFLARDQTEIDQLVSTALEGLVLESGQVDFAAPVAVPSKIICLALNYRAHADEGGLVAPSRPVIFLKGPNTLCGPDDEIVVPPMTRRIDHEGELAVVIGRQCRGLTPQTWQSAIAGYSIMNDLTARDLQLEDLAKNHPWDFTKSIDTYGPMGPWLVTPDEVPDPQDLDLEVLVDGDVKQKGSTAAMIFSVAELLCYISSVMTLEPGDVIATGTCDGIGPIPDGGRVEVTVGNLGTLVNTVRFETPTP